MLLILIFGEMHMLTVLFMITCFFIVVVGLAFGDRTNHRNKVHPHFNPGNFVHPLNEFNKTRK